MRLASSSVLLVLPQLPQDPSSGAARSVRTICEMLAASGFSVRVLATTATEQAARSNTAAFLTGLGITPRVEHSSRPELHFSDRGIDYRLLDTGARDMYGWQDISGTQFDRMFDDELATFQPDLLFAYGGHPSDIQRYARAKQKRIKLVFALRNEGYLSSREFFQPMDAILTPSQFLTNLYRTALQIESTPLPLPLDVQDVVAENRKPIFVTMINPSPEKGLMFAARLAEEMSLERPDIAMLFVESRGSAGSLVKAGLAGGFDLRRHENLMLSPPMAQPKEIYAATRTLIVPSLLQEPGGRVAAEALLNGIPPLVSDRGGLAETCNGAGFALPIPAEITPKYPHPVAPSVVLPWLKLIQRLEDDKSFYDEQSNRAREAGRIYQPKTLAPRYVEFFQGVLTK